MKRMFLCPKCGKLTEELATFYDETNVYIAYIDKRGHVDYDQVDCEGSECVGVEHSECGARICELAPFGGYYSADDFIVEIENGSIKPIGDYWKEHKELFKQLVKNLKVKEKAK